MSNNFKFTFDYATYDYSVPVRWSSLGDVIFQQKTIHPIMKPLPAERKQEPFFAACQHEKHLFTVDGRKKIIKQILAVLKPRVDEFDAIVVSGYSMALVAPTIADKLKKNIVLVRKRSEERHSAYTVEGQSHQRCLFIDDCIDTGSTFKYIKKELTKNFDSSIVGIVIYNDLDRSATRYKTPVWGSFRISQYTGKIQT